MNAEDLVQLELLRQLTVDYGYFLDTGRCEELSMLFTEDAVYDIRPTGLDVVAQGRANIRGLLQSAYDQFAGTVHYCLNQRILRLEENEAEGFCYFQALSLLKTGHRTEFLGRYVDTYRREDGRWLFQQRALVAHIPVSDEGFQAPEG